MKQTNTEASGDLFVVYFLVPVCEKAKKAELCCCIDHGGEIIGFIGISINKQEANQNLL